MNIMIFLLSLFSTMAIMNIYFHWKLARGGVFHRGKIVDAENDDDGLSLSIGLQDGQVVNIKVGRKMEDSKFYKFVEKNIGNHYDVLELNNGTEKVFIHNGSYLSKGILFSIGTFGILLVMYFNN